MSAHDDAVRAAQLLEQLLLDDRLRAEFRSAPAATFRRVGLPELADEFGGGGTPLQTLEPRESKSSLAGVFVSVAAEGLAALEWLGQHGTPRGTHRDAVINQTLSRPRVRALSRQLAIVSDNQRASAALDGAGARAAAGNVAPAVTATPEAAATATPEAAAANGRGAARHPVAFGRVVRAHAQRTRVIGTAAQPAVAAATADAAPAGPSHPADPSDYGQGGTGGVPTPEMEAILKNKNVTFDSVGIADIEHSRIDPRVIAVLTKIAREHKITVTCMCSDHPKLTTGGSTSNHAHGRGLDIGTVDGEVVRPNSTAAHELAMALSQLPEEYRPNEIGSPWPISGPGYFSDADHQDHLHIGFKQEIARDWRPPADVAVRDRAPGAPDAVAATVAGHAAGAVAGLGEHYPGDGASKEQFAAWLAKQAEKRGLPRELPVMASLVESGVKNLHGGDADSIGFFQMRVGTWNKGEYAGFPEKPELQIKWFLDQAEEVKKQRIAAGESVTDPKQYGDWIADIELPAAQYRGRYQPRLDEARGLLAGAQPESRAKAADATVEPGPSPVPKRKARTGVGDVAHRNGRAAAAAAAAADTADANEGRGRRLIDIARQEIGERETSENDSPRIAEYRTATPGGGAGPWCAYFVSWVARRAGVPLGDSAQGYANVDALWAWAQQTGRAVRASAHPQPGDLIVWDEHVGIVERVDRNGLIHTIEGNTSDQVARRAHSAAGVVGFVRLRR